MILLAALAIASCVPEGMTMPGTNIPVARVTSADVLTGASAADAEQRYRGFFRLMDANADGFISDQETSVGTSGNVSNPFTPTRSSTSEWMRLIDNSGDNRVDWKEFGEYFLPRAAIARCQKGIMDRPPAGS